MIETEFPSILLNLLIGSSLCMPVSMKGTAVLSFTLAGNQGAHFRALITLTSSTPIPGNLYQNPVNSAFLTSVNSFSFSPLP